VDRVGWSAGRPVPEPRRAELQAGQSFDVLGQPIALGRWLRDVITDGRQSGWLHRLPVLVLIDPLGFPLSR
jgi:hypothetical protein